MLHCATNPSDRKQVDHHAQPGGEAGRACRGEGPLWGALAMLCVWISVVVSQVYISLMGVVHGI